MQREYLTDGDRGFLGLNSRDNPSILPQGIVAESINFRLDKGVASVRKGLRRKTPANLTGKVVYGSGIYLDSTGQEIMVFATQDTLFVYNPETDAISFHLYPLGETITTATGCDVVHALGKVYITRGFSKRPLVWDMVGTVSVVTAHTNAMPNNINMMFYQNRLIAVGKHSSMDPIRNRDTVSVSHFLEDDEWAAVDAFTINQGGNDEIVGVAPWTMNEFLVFLRNSIFYLNTGTSRYAAGNPLANDAFLQSMTTDVGCVAKRSIVQVAGGVMFLSDNGVYFLKPQEVGAAEGMRLLTLAEPVSAPIDDVIQRINRQHSDKAVGVYWNNRYYLAVPLDGSSTNNRILVYNFILKAWESVDQYPAGFNASNMLVAKKGSQRRLYVVDASLGVFLMEDLDADEFGDGQGTPRLSFRLLPLDADGNSPAKLGFTGFTQSPINATLLSRAYKFETNREKRYSSVDMEVVVPQGGSVETFIETTNPDSANWAGFGVPATAKPVDTYVSFSKPEEVSRRNPIRKIAYSAQIRLVTGGKRPIVRSIGVDAKVLGNTNINRE